MHGHVDQYGEMLTKIVTVAKQRVKYLKEDYKEETQVESEEACIEDMKNKQNLKKGMDRTGKAINTSK